MPWIVYRIIFLLSEQSQKCKVANYYFGSEYSIFKPRHVVSNNVVF